EERGHFIEGMKLISEHLLYSEALEQMEFEAVECREEALVARRIGQRAPYYEVNRTTDDLLRYHIYEVDAGRQIDDDDVYEIVTFGKLYEQGAAADE
ncbi:MAG: hypothetical protein EBR82_68470, partial [Caulobacteraceae bacterium]|nr:hypothetical protein [Caulobacteraceae bacterium]